MRWILPAALAAMFAAGTADPATAAAPVARDSEEAAIGRVPTLDKQVARQIDQAVGHYGHGEFEDADRVLGLVIDSRDVPEQIRALALFNRGATRLQLDRFSEAIVDFDAAEALSFPRPAQLHLARGIAWEHLRILDRAANEYVQALTANPNDPAVQAKVRAFFYKK